MKRVLAIAAIVAAGLGAGCRSERTPSLVERLGAPPEAGFFDPTESFREVEVVRFDVPEARAPRPDAPNPPIVDLAVEIESGDVQVVEATILDLPRGELHLAWNLRGVDDGVDRRIVLPGMQVPGGLRKTFRFDVASESEWRGTISRLQLFTGARHRARVRLAGIRGLGWKPIEEAARGAAASPRWVDLGNDVRPAVLLLEGLPWTVARSVGAGERLRAEVGVDRGAEGPTVFELEILEGERVVRRTSLRTVDAAQSERWLEVDEDLAELAGRTLELRIVARETRPTGRRPPFAFLANPRIVAPLAGPRPPNVIVVSVDTLRADALSLYGADRPTTPFLDARANRAGAVFDQAIASAPSTLPSHASLFTGLDAHRHHAVFQAAPPGLETLAEILRARGYRTFARTGGGYLHPRWGLVQGFDRYAYWLNTYDRDGELEAGLAGALELLDAEPEAPFLLFLHTYEVHSPYRVRSPHFRELWPGAERPDELVWIEAEEPTAATGYRVPRRAEYRLGGPDPNLKAGPRVDAAVARRLYLSSVAYVDAQLERLWRVLDERKLWRDTVVVVTSDHGEAFGEHGVAGHGYLYDDNLRVPLILFAPQVDAPVRVPQQVRLVDVLPTLLELVGVPAPEGIDGHSLVRRIVDGQDPDLPREAWAYAGNSVEGAALRIGGRAKLIFDDSSTGGSTARRLLFDLAADPGELVDREADDPLADRLEREVRERLLRELAGLELVLRSDGGSRRVRISGEGVDPRSAKLLAGDHADLEWRDKRLTALLRPGEPLVLVLLGELGEELELAIVVDDAVAEGGPGEFGRLALDRVPSRWSWDAASGWRDGEGPPAALEVRASWNGRSGRTSTVGARPDTELIRQLQALGYVH